MEHVSKGDRLEEGGQIVESVGTLADDAQKQIDLARREERQVVLRGVYIVDCCRDGCGGGSTKRRPSGSRRGRSEARSGGHLKKDTQKDNEARHLWNAKDSGVPAAPYASATDGRRLAKALGLPRKKMSLKYVFEEKHYFSFY